VASACIRATKLLGCFTFRLDDVNAFFIGSTIAFARMLRSEPFPQLTRPCFLLHFAYFRIRKKFAGEIRTAILQATSAGDHHEDRQDLKTTTDESPFIVDCYFCCRGYLNEISRVASDRIDGRFGGFSSEAVACAYIASNCRRSTLERG
jgi:hypothetical protein